MYHHHHNLIYTASHPPSHGNSGPDCQHYAEERDNNARAAFLFPGIGSEPAALLTPAMSRTSTEHLDIPTPLLAPPVSPGLCSICHDRATGKHYGASSCDGCKGFFRRTIRKDQRYTCRFDKKCLIDKDKRNSCRFCRFRKCLLAGMRRDAVQNERDRIQKRIKREPDGEFSPSPSPRSSTSTPLPSPLPRAGRYKEYIDILLKAEALYTASQLRATVITRTADQMPSPTSTGFNNGEQNEWQGDDFPPIATVNDVSESMHQQLLLMVEWAKTLEPFTELSIEDQIVLLRCYAAQHLLICVAHRSRHVEDHLLLTNATCLPRQVSHEVHDVKGFSHVTIRVLDELVAPMNQLGIDETEFVCLRAIVFFNPRAKGLDKMVGVEKTRNGILSALQEHVLSKADPVARFGNLLLLLPPLQAISQNLIEDVQLASMFGILQIDSLLQELLLAGVEEIGGMTSGALRYKDADVSDPPGDIMFGPFQRRSRPSIGSHIVDEDFMDFQDPKPQLK